MSSATLGNQQGIRTTSSRINSGIQTQRDGGVPNQPGPSGGLASNAIPMGVSTLGGGVTSVGGNTQQSDTFGSFVSLALVGGVLYFGFKAIR
jgi:hypothetical protein